MAGTVHVDRHFGEESRVGRVDKQCNSSDVSSGGTVGSSCGRGRYLASISLASSSSGAAEKLETMTNIFFIPSSLGALPALWLQAKLTISLAPFQEKFAKLFLTIAAELWLRGRPEAIDSTFQSVARSVKIRLAERLAKFICQNSSEQTHIP